ncbi:hypothetical protein [Pseudomonas sp. ANT_H12B]|uniref:hypothetical protein n=1 Tax=Pseudomonas sp. ANT_H12B TaxID=2597348 RepID=UPI0011EDD3BE|nr:hypothetical protein [Pseudomonas sp. ANT_H12B]KAA0968773.1 hypothetical protein FQ185_19310 [Pseudomonas sp. ANT_H12B]
MPEDNKDSSASSQQLLMALSKWDNEGAADTLQSNEANEIPELSNAELVHLRIRVIALENLVIALLAQGSDQQLAVAREMAGYITPRPGFTQHPLTIHAASQMVDSVDRAVRFRKLSGA